MRLDYLKENLSNQKYESLNVYGTTMLILGIKSKNFGSICRVGGPDRCVKSGAAWQPSCQILSELTEIIDLIFRQIWMILIFVPNLVNFVPILVNYQHFLR